VQILTAKDARPEILVYKRNRAHFFRPDFNHPPPTSVSHDPSRKSFLAKMIGLVAVAGLAPRLAARAATSRPETDRSSATPAITLRPDARAVARRADSV
jgi:hypothetical protein